MSSEESTKDKINWKGTFVSALINGIVQGIVLVVTLKIFGVW